jgi:dihydropteroate synthase
LEASTIEAMVPLAARLGLEIVTGSDWLLLAGPRYRMGAFARPWVQPEPVRALAEAIGLALPADRDGPLIVAGNRLELDSPTIVGIVNSTPDSFSATSRANTIPEVVAMVDRHVADGVRVIDIGGQSTRPGATLLSAAIEMDRVLPAIAAVRAAYPDLAISIDTVHATTARSAIELGVGMINDVTGGRHDPEMLAAVAQSNVVVVLTHSRGDLPDIASYRHTAYPNGVADEVAGELSQRVDAAMAAGINPDRIVLDPGFGFGKTTEQGLALLNGLDAIVGLGFPTMIGPSRKRFLGEVTGRDVTDRDRATAAACVLGYDRGARLFRVHDANAVRDALSVSHAMGRGS